MPNVIIQDDIHPTSLLKVTFERISGEGRVLPTIVVVAQIETLIDGIKVRPFNMNIKLKIGDDIIGLGSLRECGKEIDVHARQVMFDIQTTQQAIKFVKEQFRQDYLDASLWFDSLLHYTGGTSSTGRFIKPPTSALSFKISRLDWLKQVLEPIKYADFTLLELPIPEIPNREQWMKALNHIDEAEAQYGTGNDPGVFSRCYAAYEAIKPIEKHLESVANEDKRNAIKSMFDKMRRYYNEGRHVETAGAQSGQFPGDHRDAEFALYLAKSSVAYLAKLVHKV